VNNDSKSLKILTASRTPSSVVILAAAVAATRIARANASNDTSCLCSFSSSSPNANTIKLSTFASNLSRRRLVDLRGSRDATRFRKDDDGDAEESAKCFSKISGRETRTAWKTQHKSFLKAFFLCSAACVVSGVYGDEVFCFLSSLSVCVVCDFCCGGCSW